MDLRQYFSNAGDEARFRPYITYTFSGIPDGVSGEWLSKQLHNGLIERALVSEKGQEFPMIEYVPVAEGSYSEPAEIDLEVSDDELIRISEEGLLALNLEEMHNPSALQEPNSARASQR